MSENHWFEIENADEIPSPSLLIYEERVKENIGRAIGQAGDAARLRTHVKTHKMPGVIGLQLEAGITKFKCATIAEAEMAAASGAPDVMLACQPVGPNIGRLRTLAGTWPGTEFSTIVDDLENLHALSEAFAAAGFTIPVLLDLDTGMHRTGMPLGPNCLQFYREIQRLPGVSAGGLHLYDGHIREADAGKRLTQCELEFAPVLELVDEIRRHSLPLPRIVIGGSATFPVHARERIANLECSPGTFVFWDQGYSTTFPDIDFQVAALVLTRVISKPGESRLCFDLGHKAIASENPKEHRVALLGLPDAEVIGHSEEHLVVRTARADAFRVGQAFYGVPWHICPTVALYGDAVVVRQRNAAGRWKVAARERMLSV